MKSTKLLMADHESILEALHILDAICTEIEHDKEVNYDDIHSLLAFLYHFADGSHHVKEEAILFPALMQAEMTFQEGPLRVMTYEHERGRALTSAMEDSLTRSDRHDFVRYGRRYIELLTEHIEKENYVLFPMADQVCRAIAWVYENAASFGGDRDRIYVGGQSSGAHLTAVALTTDWAGQYGLPIDPIRGGLCASGMYELAPVRLTVRSNYVKFTEEMVEKLSPTRHLQRLRTPLIVSYGTCETPEFQRQALEFAAAATATGTPVEVIVGENYCHTELLETLCNPYGQLGAAVLKQMGLAPR